MKLIKWRKTTERELDIINYLRAYLGVLWLLGVYVFESWTWGFL